MYRISQARILECVAICYSRGSFWPRDRTWVSCISWTDGQILSHCATCEVHSVAMMCLSLFLINYCYSERDYLSTCLSASISAFPCLDDFFLRTTGLPDSHQFLKYLDSLFLTCLLLCWWTRALPGLCPQPALVFWPTYFGIVLINSKALSPSGSYFFWRRLFKIFRRRSWHLRRTQSHFPRPPVSSLAVAAVYSTYIL